MIKWFNFYQLISARVVKLKNEKKGKTHHLTFYIDHFIYIFSKFNVYPQFQQFLFWPKKHCVKIYRTSSIFNSLLKENAINQTSKKRANERFSFQRNFGAWSLGQRETKTILYLNPVQNCHRKNITKLTFQALSLSQIAIKKTNK